jgi:undecaprenyl diphosphate synthase
MNDVFLEEDKEVLLKKIIPSKLPSHIAMILDGNRRWARANGLQDYLGHRAGVKNIHIICNIAKKYGIKYLTLYCLSVENLNRCKEELSFLFREIKLINKKHITKALEQGIKISILGDFSYLPKDIANSLNDVSSLYKEIESTNEYKIDLNLQLCISYSGRNDILNAVKKIKEQNIDVDNIDEKVFGDFLMTNGLPDIDLMIRAGGEKRLSNFLLWQLSYTELYFCDKMWPEFNEYDFLVALYFFQNRLRRYGR